MRVPTTSAHLFFLRKKTPASHRARVGTSTVSLARANREVKERVKGKASRVQSTRIGSALVCVRRNVQHRELKLSKSTRFELVTVVMVAVPTGCVVSPPPLFSQNMQSHEKPPTSHRAQGVPPTVSLALGANRKGKGRVKGKASRIQSSRIGSALVCVRRNAQHPELKLPESTRFVLNTVLMVAVSTRVCVCFHPICSGRQTCGRTVQYNGEFLPDIILLTLCYQHLGTRLNAIKEFLSLQPMFAPEHFGNLSPLLGGCPE